VVGGWAATVTYIDANTLTLGIPMATLGLQDVGLTNPDSTSYTLENAFTIN
jgi:hypothetical protein